MICTLWMLKMAVTEEVVNNGDSTVFLRLDPDLCVFRTALNLILPFPTHMADLRL
ncbi:hypothetical protein Hanom_Chr02g00126861 [Helianthus anomalus]